MRLSAYFISPSLPTVYQPCLNTVESEPCVGGTMREAPGKKAEAFYLKCILFSGLFLDVIPGLL